MYQKGELKIHVEGDFAYNPEIGEAYLPHSCDEWVIGGKEDLLRLREDINELLEKMK